MGRKNKKNKYKNQQQTQQQKKVLEQKKEETIIEVIEPIAEVNTQPVEVIEKGIKEEMMNKPTEIIGTSSVIEEEIIGKPQPVINTPQQIITTNQQIVTQPVYQQPIRQIEQQVTEPIYQQPQSVRQSVYQQPQQIEQPVVQQPQSVGQPIYQQPQQVAPKVYEKPPAKVDLLITKNPKSSFSEALKSVRTNLQFAAVEKEIKVVLVSSPEPGDGKSLISSNLAGAYAQENKKVLIIDCDLRKGRQAEIFKIKKLPTMGYTNLILKYNSTATNNFKVEDYICKTGVANVDLIPNGPTPPNPIELLSSSKNKELLDELKEKYDLIILDCPPVLGLSDALVMTKYSDANIIVISKGKTKVESLAEVKRSFAKVNSSITGVITNKAKRKHNSYYGYYGE